MTSMRSTDVIGGKNTRSIILLNSICANFSFTTTPLREERLSEKSKTGSLFGYVQCVIEVPENLREAFGNFPPIFENINVSRDDIGPFLKKHAKKEGN